ARGWTRSTSPCTTRVVRCWRTALWVMRRRSHSSSTPAPSRASSSCLSSLCRVSPNWASPCVIASAGLVRELLGDGGGKRVGDHVHVRLHRGPLVRLAGGVIGQDQVDLR